MAEIDGKRRSTVDADASADIFNNPVNDSSDKHFIVTDEDELYPKNKPEPEEPQDPKKKRKKQKPKKVKKKKAPKPKKKSLMSFKNLQSEIESHGFTFSFKTFILQAILFEAVAIVIAYFCKMSWTSIAFLVLVALFAIPYIVKSQFDQMYQINRFNMVVNYLDNLIPIFKNKPVIASAWKDVLDLTDGRMHELLDAAIKYLETNTDDVTPELTAFQIIEREFPNSRIHAVHQMMYTIVRQNTRSYQQSVDNMYYDVQGWISRTYNFQKDLKNRRTKMILLCLMTMGCNCMFTFMYGSGGDMFAGFTEMAMYQISTFIFLTVMLIMISMVMIKMNGAWLVDDKVDTQTNRYEKAFDRAVIHPNPKPSKPQLVMAGIFGALAAYMYISTKSIPAFLGIGLISFMLIMQNKMRYNTAKSTIQRAMEIEFPTWLRDVALNLQNMTVINSIESSKVTVTPIFAYYIDIFLKRIKENPTSIKPFNDFLDVCDLPNIKSSMKVLFTMQNLREDQIMEQSNSLIMRNQSMIAKSEQLKNEDSIGAIESLGFLPVVMLSLQLLVSMAMMFVYMMNYLSSAMGSI